MTYWRLLCETSARGVKGTSVAYCLQKFPETADLNDPKASRMQPAAPDKFTLVGLWQILRNVLYSQIAVGYFCALESAALKRWAWTGNIPSKTAQEQNVGKAGLHLDLSLLLSLNMMPPHFPHATSIYKESLCKKSIFELHVGFLRTSLWPSARNLRIHPVDKQRFVISWYLLWATMNQKQPNTKISGNTKLHPKSKPISSCQKTLIINYSQKHGPNISHMNVSKFAEARHQEFLYFRCFGKILRSATWRLRC